MSKGVFLDFEPELYDVINKYRISLGWTWKRLVMVGWAEAIAKQGDNPDLVLKIVELLEARR